MSQELFYRELRRLRFFLEDYNLLNTPIIVGVSGGKDSVFLVRMLREITEKIMIAHINYQLRGIESDKDHEFVKGLANELNVPIYDKVIPILHELAQGGNLQALARERRYEFYNSLLNNNDNAVVFVAHHQRDQVETVIRNLVHGAGVTGLSGIREVNGRIYRPLLKVSIANIEKIMGYKEWQWREDLSNLDTAYDRNYIRHEIIPLFYNLNKQATERIAHTATLMKEAQIILEHFLEAFFEEHLHFFSEHSFTLHKESLLNSGVVQTILYGICKKHHIKERVITEIIKLAEGHVGGKIELPNYDIWNEREVLRFQYKEELKGVIKTLELYSIEETINQSFIIGEYKIEGALSDKMENEFYNNVLHLPVSEIRWPLKLRTWQQGDQMQPFGMRGNKKISRIFIDHKIANADKNRKIIVSDQKGIFSILGVKNSERTRILEKKYHILQLKFTKII